MGERLARANRRYAVLIAGLTLAGLALRVWRLGDMALIGDEGYYWLWSRYLDWAFFDHPAGIALLIRASTALGGPSEAGIRWMNALLGTAAIPIVYLAGRTLLSRRAGLFASAVLAFGAPYLLTSRFVYTDALQLVLMLLSLILFWRLVQPGEREALPLGRCVAWGLSMALLFNTKYNAYLFALALAFAVLAGARWLLSQGRFWLAVTIAAAGLVPALAWNAAHDWASYRWQLSHMGFNLAGDWNLLSNAHHALAYLTWPVVVLALLGLGRVRRPAERLLTLVALLLLVPVALSPANSPRNLANGAVLLLLLAGTRWPVSLAARSQRLVSGVLAGLLLATAVYGVGTLVNLSGPSPWPRSSTVQDIRADAAGWHSLGPELEQYPQPFFALDYSIASQIRYYTGGSAYTAWPQFQIWQIPDLNDATVISLDYLPPDLVTSRLEGAFEQVQGPEIRRYNEYGAAKEVRIWEAKGRRLPMEALLEQLDFLNLVEQAR